MSALVGYGSSDEDESIEDHALTNKIQISGAAGIDGASTNNGVPIIDSQPNYDELDNQGPMVGPAKPEISAQDLGEYQDEPVQDISDLSERDKLRHLTQPSFPMNALPPSPSGSPDPAANAKFRRFLDLKAKGIHFNEDLARKTTFQNPNLLSILMERAGVLGDAQYQNSLPSDVFDPSMFPASAFKEELLKSQQKLKEQADSQRKEMSAAGKRTIDFTASNKSGHSSRESTPMQQMKRKKV